MTRPLPGDHGSESGSLPRHDRQRDKTQAGLESPLGRIGGLRQGVQNVKEAL